MTNRLIRSRTLPLMAILTLGAAAVSPAADHQVSLTQDPLVMRLSKDEFRIAFGIDAPTFETVGCSGTIRYRVNWRTDGGKVRSETKEVSYTVLPRSSRTIAVDRQYLDVSEGAHMTEIVKVSVEEITCLGGSDSRSL